MTPKTRNRFLEFIQRNRESLVHNEYCWDVKRSKQQYVDFIVFLHIDEGIKSNIAMKVNVRSKSVSLSR